jgi:hypothetical protein
MRGVQRPRIPGAAGELQQRRLVRYSRGRITILDGKGLLAASCSGYEQIKSACGEV